MNATPHILESALLLLATFFIGCLIGYGLRRVFGKPPIGREKKDGSPVAAVLGEPAPATVPKPASAPSTDLKQIKGIGPTMEKRLKAEGIEDLAQIAAWNEDTIARMDEKLNARGRIEREEWVKQAKALAGA